MGTNAVILHQKTLYASEPEQKL